MPHVIDHNPEQAAVLDLFSGNPANLMIQARAGCGKSTILRLIDAACTGPALYLCFNRDAAASATKAGLRPITQVRTFNALGHRLWAARCPHNLQLVPDKVYNIFAAIGESLAPALRADHWSRYDLVREALTLTRAMGYIPESHPRAAHSLCGPEGLIGSLSEIPDPQSCVLIDTVLLESIRQAQRGTIDFADQTYMPTLFGASWPRFPLVLVDEFQDLSPINLQMLSRLTPYARLIGVGDDAQAIYAFRGARADAMAYAIYTWNMISLPLSTSYRCPEAIVRNVQWRAPDFRAFRPGGTVSETRGLCPPTDAILCRNNAPLVAMGLDLAARGITVSLANLDVGPKVLSTLRKLGSEDTPRTEVESAIERWELARLQAGSRTAADLAATMLVLARQGRTLDQTLAYAKHLFTPTYTSSITLSTGHRAKGLEWPRVVHLDRAVLSNQGQDPNLRYVIDTRASESLIYLDININ